jgi:hypothetical protein
VGFRQPGRESEREGGRIVPTRRATFGWLAFGTNTYSKTGKIVAFLVATPATPMQGSRPGKGADRPCLFSHAAMATQRQLSAYTHTHTRTHLWGKRTQSPF